MMMCRANSLAVILNLLLMMHLAASHSLPRNQRVLVENQTVIRREASNSNSSIRNDDSPVSELTLLKTELANLSIPSYLKELYINLTFPNRMPSSLHNEEINFNTIQSYKNKAKSKLNISKEYQTYICWYHKN